MKRALVMLFLAVLLLAGCAKKESSRFVLSDVIITEPAGCEHYTISVCLPAGVIEAVSTVGDTGRLYEAPDGSYYIVTQVLSGCTAADAIRQMTGSDAKSLGALRTMAMSMPEYRFSWCMAGEQGMLACTGIVLEDQNTCYCLQFCAQEDKAKDCATQKEQVLSGFGLYKDEGF